MDAATRSITSLLFLLGVSFPISAWNGAMAQGLTTPSAHWGAIMLPDFQERTDYGLHFLGFTEFGKEVVPGTEQYLFIPYNDIHQTLGFNIVSYTRTTNFRLRREPIAGAPVTPSPLMRRFSFSVGLVNDVIPRFLQNDIIHWARWRGENTLRGVPRTLSDTPDDVGLGPTKSTPVAQFSDEYFMRLSYVRRRDGHEERVPTPLFLGGGWTVGTVNQEGFVHAGATVADYVLSPCFAIGGVRLRSAGAGGIARLGLLAPGVLLNDLTAAYGTVQGVGRLSIDWWSFPTQFEFGLTAMHGYFVATRTPADRAIIAEFPVETRDIDVYQAKRALNERFLALRVRVGEFTFETYNDNVGGKDKGPSFGASISFNAYRPRSALVDPARQERALREARR
jgi:hypothetical protein